MQFIVIKAQYARIEDQVNDRIRRKTIMVNIYWDPRFRELGAAVPIRRRKHCIGVSSGTDALLMAMMALNRQG